MLYQYSPLFGKKTILVGIISILICGIYLFLSSALTGEIIISPLKKNKNTTIFAAYSADGTVSDYVISYLKGLKEVSPNIIYVTDNPLPRKEKYKISPYVNTIIAGRHGEYDWGSYKRGYMWLNENGSLISKGKLIFANDSVLGPLTPLPQVFKKMQEQPADFWGITANQDGTYHLQSYFLVFSPQVYLDPEFARYLYEVTKQKDGLTVAYRYEVPFTGFLENLGYKSAAYLPYESLSYLPLNDKNCYPLSLLSVHNAPFLKMRTFTTRLNVQEPRRLVLQWLRKNRQSAYIDLKAHLKKINSPYLKDKKS